MNVLEKKLVEISEKTAEKGDEIVQDVKLLLEGAASEERATLKSIGLDFDLNLAESKLEEQIIKNTAKDRFGKAIILAKDIKEMCVKYRLYMKPAKQYIGTIPLTLGAELTRFCKEKNIVLPAHYSGSPRFFIIAPPKMFKGYLYPYQVCQKTMNDMEIEREEERKRREEDPILVYKLDEPGYYAIIKSWGNDFSWLRRVYGFFTCQKNIGKVNWWLNTTMFWLLIYGLWKFNYFAATYHNPYVPGGNWSSTIWLLPSIVITIVVLTIEGFWLWNTEPGGSVRARKHLMDTVTEHERIAQY